MRDKLGDWAAVVLFWGLIRWVLLLRNALAWAIVFPPCWSLIKLGKWHNRALELRSQALWRHPPDLKAARAGWGLAVLSAGFAVLLAAYVDLLDGFGKLTRGILFDLSERGKGDAPPE